jgi:ribosomal protein L37AE/L43A
MKEYICPQCGDAVPAGRVALGRRLCLPCGEKAAAVERRGWTVAPMHKSNYMLLVDRADLLGINTKQSR